MAIDPAIKAAKIGRHELVLRAVSRRLAGTISNGTMTLRVSLHSSFILYTAFLSEAWVYYAGHG
ncbi:hypothetical protein L3476_05320 [Paenibacillus thiaminolyticus]|uniref:hypothetical protein n=1 Tax=Paenibacillus thiaminolyticus TaxID=49283 RepID=UPI00234FDAF3|nr:hypothetical protein [Paenibacillus thiaminolyticus]WCR28175.1 hypothetical protein L3476_05320 [Paenibacillus thiaminolyticus]